MFLDNKDCGRMCVYRIGTDTYDGWFRFWYILTEGDSQRLLACIENDSGGNLVQLEPHQFSFV